MKILINNLKQMEKLGKIIADCYKKGMIICMDGDLGAGKTTLTQFIGKHLNINEYITSPTFNIIKEYKSDILFYHMDAYRLSNIEDAYDLDIEKYIYSDGIFIIEWSDKIKDILPENRINIEIKTDYINNKREIYINGSGDDFECLKKELNKIENYRN